MDDFRLEDKTNDWLAREKELEKRESPSGPTPATKLQAEHRMHCEAEKIKEQHSQACDAEELREETRKGIEYLLSRANWVLVTIVVGSSMFLATSLLSDVSYISGARLHC